MFSVSTNCGNKTNQLRVRDMWVNFWGGMFGIPSIPLAILVAPKVHIFRIFVLRAPPELNRWPLEPISPRGKMRI